MTSPSAPLVSGDLIRQLEWKRYQEAVALYFELQGRCARESALGADGGIDIRLYDSLHSPAPYAVVQCKAWSPRDEIDITEIRAFTDVMSKARVDRAYYFATCRITSYIKLEARERQIETVDTDEFVDRLNRLSEAQRQTWLAAVTHGDFHTPTCRRCGGKMRPTRPGPMRPRWWCAPCRVDQPMRREDRERYAAHRRVAAPVVTARASTSTVRTPLPPPSPRRTPPRLPSTDFVPPLLSTPKTTAAPRRRKAKVGTLLAALLFVFVGAWLVAHTLPPLLRASVPVLTERAPPSSRPPAPTVVHSDDGMPKLKPSHSPKSPAQAPPMAKIVSPPTQKLLRFQMPKAVFHLNIEAQATATDDQLRHATTLIDPALRIFDRDARPPFLAIATLRDSAHTHLGAYVVYDTRLEDFVSRDVYLTAPQPNRTIAIVHRFPCYFVGGDRIAP